MSVYYTGSLRAASVNVTARPPAPGRCMGGDDGPHWLKKAAFSLNPSQMIMAHWHRDIRDFAQNPNL
jgi:hypothetical protein